MLILTIDSIFVLIENKLFSGFQGDILWGTVNVNAENTYAEH